MIVLQGSGFYEVREDLLDVLLSHHVTAEEVARAAGRPFAEESMGFGLPTIRTVAVDWDHVRRVRREQVPRRRQAFLASLEHGRTSVDEAREELHRIEADTWRLQQYALGRVRAAQHRTLASASWHAWAYSGLAATARLVSDLSKDILIIGATVATGGSATMLFGLGAAGVVSGSRGYAETEHRPLRTALWNAGTTIAFGVVDVVNPVGRASHVVIALARGGSDAVGSLLEGKAAGEALTDGAFGSAGPLFEHLAATRLVKRTLQHSIVPARMLVTVRKHALYPHAGERRALKAAVSATSSLMQGLTSTARVMAPDTLSRLFEPSSSRCPLDDPSCVAADPGLAAAVIRRVM